ncbi:MAG: cupin domain-containing protein [Streptosporangiales bacterium]|nr:cupin domain-containing protein [Streptosporangiales bacterium]
MSAFRELGSIRPKPIWDGVLARIVQGKLVTMSIVELEPDVTVPEHRHENEQLGFVIEGSVTFTVGEETRELGPGGTWRILADIPHHVQVGANGAVVAEVYSPVRSDWEQLEPTDEAPVRWPTRT